MSLQDGYFDRFEDDMDRELARSILVSKLAEMPDIRRRLLDDHGPDAGGFCLSCRRHNVKARWPCRLWDIGTTAERVATNGLPPEPIIASTPRHRLR